MISNKVIAITAVGLDIDEAVPVVGG